MTTWLPRPKETHPYIHIGEGRPKHQKTSGSRWSSTQTCLSLHTQCLRAVDCFFRQQKKGVGFLPTKTSQMTSTYNALKRTIEKKRRDVGNKKKHTPLLTLRPSSAGCVLYNVPPQSCIPRAKKKKTTTPSRVRISCDAVISSVMVTILNFTS